MTTGKGKRRVITDFADLELRAILNDTPTDPTLTTGRAPRTVLVIDSPEGRHYLSRTPKEVHVGVSSPLVSDEERRRAKKALDYMKAYGFTSYGKRMRIKPNRTGENR